LCCTRTMARRRMVRVTGHASRAAHACRPPPTATARSACTHPHTTAPLGIAPVRMIPRYSRG
jgi:hypothetical protein